jgi:hypothetical protein
MKWKKVMRKRLTPTERCQKMRKNLIKRANNKNFKNSGVDFLLSVADHVHGVIASIDRFFKLWFLFYLLFI